jgi:hypothetical protein
LFLKAASAALIWHLRMAAANFATLLTTASSHLEAVALGGPNPVSSRSVVVVVLVVAVVFVVVVVVVVVVTH